MNPPNNIRNGFFTPVSHFFSKVRKLTVFSRNPHTPIILQSVRLRMGRGRVIRAEKTAVRPVRPAHSNSSETKKIICPTHAAHVGHMTGDLMGAYSFHRLQTPSTACGRSPSLEEGGLGGSRPLEDSYTTPGAGSQPCSFQRGLWGS